MGDDAKSRNKGHSEAHTLPRRADIETSAIDLAEELRARRGGDQLGLLPEDEDVEPADGPLLTSTSSANGRRGAGRPKGSGNKRTVHVRDMLLAKGYRHPLEVLASFASADVHALAAELGCKPKDAADKIINAASRLAPYFESAMPTAVKVDSAAVHYFIAGQLDTAPAASDGGSMSLFGAGGKTVEHQRLSPSGSVRPNGGGSHDTEQAVDNADENSDGPHDAKS